MAVAKQTKKKGMSFTAIVVIIAAGTVLFIMLAGGKWAIIGVLAGSLAGLVAGYKLAKGERKDDR